MWVHSTSNYVLDKTVLGRITTDTNLPKRRGEHFLLVDRVSTLLDLDGWAAILTTCNPKVDELTYLTKRRVPVFHGMLFSHHLSDGDIVAASPKGDLRTLYRKHSYHNSIMLTEACNSFCLMCSQPPKTENSRDCLPEISRLIELIAPETKVLGFTGGEPTLLKRDLIRILLKCKYLLPNTAIHLLSNGRLFYYGSYVRDLAQVKHPDLLIGIPLYSDVDFIHDFVVQAKGAFDQTLIGLHNLGRWGIPVEIRVVIHKYTYTRLAELAEFICRNLPFSSHVALMGLEIMGFTIPNLKDLWVDPHDYRGELVAATQTLAKFGIHVSIFNHQLCTVHPSLWPFCKKSISDWKNDYLPECLECAALGECGGFFSSSLLRVRSAHISPLSREKFAQTKQHEASSG